MREIRLLDDTVLKVHDESDQFSNALIRDRDYYERDILDYIADKHPVNEIILDIGANIGNHVAYFAQYLEYSRIIAYEPVLDNFILLRQNVKQFPNITVRREAVGDERKMAHVYLNRTNMGAAEVHEENWTGGHDGEEIVQQVRVDDLLVREKVTLIKIDVEWSEPKVLAGARNIILEDKPIILIEDVHERYMKLFYDLGYHLEAGWPHHKTYLYVA